MKEKTSEQMNRVVFFVSIILVILLVVTLGIQSIKKDNKFRNIETNYIISNKSFICSLAQSEIVWKRELHPSAKFQDCEDSIFRYEGNHKYVIFSYYDMQENCPKTIRERFYERKNCSGELVRNNFVMVLKDTIDGWKIKEGVLV